MNLGLKCCQMYGKNIINYNFTPLLNRRQILFSTMSDALKKVPIVEIDEGVFKYILMKVYDKALPDVPPITILRGNRSNNYHSDIYDEVQTKLEPLDLEPIGGGRISHNPVNKKLHIYGYSQGFGRADHEFSAKLLKAAYPGYTITTSDEGY